MGVWITMLAVVLIMPVTMIIFGRVYSENPPKKISRVAGYRTSMSMKNADTWEFAHRYFGRLWFAMGLILLLLSALLMLLVLKDDENTVALLGGAVCMLQIVPVTISIIATERALYKNFDKNGMRK